MAAAAVTVEVSVALKEVKKWALNIYKLLYREWE